MSRGDRAELERQTQLLDRKRPDSSAAELEAELETAAPVPYGNWKDETPNLRSRLRQVQRWRKGTRGRAPGQPASLLFPFLWPIGERQRHDIDPSYTPSTVRVVGSWRIFLQNCGPEVVRDVRIRVDQMEVDYAPSIHEGKFQEVHWQRVDGIKQMAFGGFGEPQSRHRLEVEFVVAKGTRNARLEGDLVLDQSQGWTFFGSVDGRQREVE